MKYSTIKVLDKASFLKVLSQIQNAFSEFYSNPLKINRRKRRGLYRGGRDYRKCIRDLKDNTKRALGKATEMVLEKMGLNEDILNESWKHLDSDQEVALAISKICTVSVVGVSPLLVPSRLTEIIEFSITRSRELSHEDPNELNIKIKMLEDEVFEEFGFEPEEIEAGVRKYHSELINLIQTNRENNNYLLENTNEVIF